MYVQVGESLQVVCSRDRGDGGGGWCLPVASMCVCVYACVCACMNWMGVGGGVSRDKNRIGRDRMGWNNSRIGIGRTYLRIDYDYWWEEPRVRSVVQQ